MIGLSVGLLGSESLIGIGMDHDAHWLNKRIDYNLLPAQLHGAAKRYIEYGISPGGFLTAAFSNDFVDAACRADIDNQQPRALKAIAHFILNEMPPASHGSRAAVNAWIARGGLRGTRAKRVEEVTHTITKEENEL